jgi:hypothetical protein
MTNRSLSYHPISGELVATFFDEVAFWLLPGSLHIFSWRLRLAMIAAFVAMGLAAYFLALRRSARETVGGNPAQRLALPGLIALYAFFFLVIIYLNTTVLDASTDIPGVQRYVIPLLAVGVVWAFSSYSLFARGRLSSRLTLVFIVLACLGVASLYAYKSVRFIRNPGFAFGYTDVKREWRCEIEAIHSIPPERALIASDYEQVYFLAERPPYAMPNKFDHYRQVANENLYEDLSAIERYLDDGAVLVAIGNPDAYPETVNGLAANLEIWKECSHARLYVRPEFIE